MRALIPALAAAIVLASSTCVAQWTTVGDGVDYREWVLPDPNRLFVARMARSNMSVTLETCLPYARLAGGRETTTAMSARMDDAIGYWNGTWGMRNDVVVAVNGDFFNTTTGVPLGGQIHSGWYSKSLATGQGGAAFAWTLGRVMLLTGCLETATESLTVTVTRTGQTLAVSGVNRPRLDNELILYTPQYDTTTRTDASGVEVMVEMERPTVPAVNAGVVVGRVREIRRYRQGAELPFDHVVLSATGTAAAALLDTLSPGVEVSISLKLNASNALCQSGMPSPFWNGAYAAMHGNAVMLNAGVILGEWDTVRHPRTCIAWNNDYVFLVVCDGRSTISRGMTGTELASFCRNTLGATFGMNLDGGGSSTMVVNGVIRNVPSDGRERAVGNGLMIVNTRPKLQSGDFSAGQYVSVLSNTDVRLGPGTNYGTVAQITAGSPAVIQSHAMNGIYAKGAWWWKIAREGAIGWVDQTVLAAYGTLAPVITEQPGSATVCSGNTMQLTVMAEGSGKLSYRWSRDGQELHDGARYSGTSASTLTVASFAGDDAGRYRCRVSSDYGEALSDEATITVRSGVSVSIGSPSLAATRTGPVLYSVFYLAADAITLAPSDVQLQTTGTAQGRVLVAGSGSLLRTVIVTDITGDGTIRISVPSGTAVGCGLAPAAGPSEAFVVDNTPPSGVSVQDEGAFTPSLNSLTAWWSQAQDPGGSGIAGYQYAAGTSPGSINLRAWISVGKVTQVTDQNLNMREGAAHYMQVRAIDLAGNTGLPSSTDGILAAPGVEHIGGAWQFADGMPLSLRGKPVTAAGDGVFWLQEPAQMSALEVRSQTYVSTGNAVSVAGVLSLQGCHRVLLADVVHTDGPCPPLRPVGIRASNLGGSAVNEATPGVAGATGPYNEGLLVRCWGRVTPRAPGDPPGFRIDDGSMGGAGLLVLYDGETPATGAYAFVTGVVSSVLVGDECKPTLRVTDPAEVTVWPR